MFHKNTKQKETDTFPFTEDHIKKFKDELEKSGGFDELMIKKQAMSKNKGFTFVTVHEDIELYKSVFLIGIYESLRPFYDTEYPYTFWTELYKVLESRDNEQAAE